MCIRDRCRADLRDGRWWRSPPSPLEKWGEFLNGRLLLTTVFDHQKQVYIKKSHPECTRMRHFPPRSQKNLWGGDSPLPRPISIGRGKHRNEAQQSVQFRLLQCAKNSTQNAPNRSIFHSEKQQTAPVHIGT